MATILSVSFGTYRRRRKDVKIERQGYLPLRLLGDVPLRPCWVFHLRCTCHVAVAYRDTLLRRRYDVLLPGGLALTSYILKHKNDVLKKTKLPKLYIC